MSFNFKDQEAIIVKYPEALKDQESQFAISEEQLPPGKILTPDQYKLLVERFKTVEHLQVNWVNPKGRDCKIVGPSALCFCGHRFREHMPHLNEDKDQACKMGSCECVEYSFVPAQGTADLRCSNCKQTFRNHDTQNPHPLKGDKKTCPKFAAKWSCICKQEFDEHRTIFETRDERIKAGKNVGNNASGFSVNSYSNECETNYEEEYNSMQSLLGDHKYEKSLEQNQVKKSFKVFKVDFENKENEEKMKRLGFKDLEIIDNEINLDEFMVNKFDPLRIGHRTAIQRLNQNEQYEDVKGRNELKRNPLENSKKRHDFIKSQADLVNEKNNIKKAPREELSYVESFKGKKKKGPQAQFKNSHLMTDLSIKENGCNIYSAFKTPLDIEFFVKKHNFKLY